MYSARAPVVVAGHWGLAYHEAPGDLVDLEVHRYLSMNANLHLGPLGKVRENQNVRGRFFLVHPASHVPVFGFSLGFRELELRARARCLLLNAEGSF